MKKTNKCELCGTGMKRLYFKIGCMIYGCGWVCENYPNSQESIHYVLDKYVDITLISKQKDRERNLRHHIKHENVDADSMHANCMGLGSVRRVYLNKGTWKKVGWLCIGCKNIVWEHAYEQDLRNLRITKLKKIGVYDEPII